MCLEVGFLPRAKVSPEGLLASVMWSDRLGPGLHSRSGSDSSGQACGPAGTAAAVQAGDESGQGWSSAPHHTVATTVFSLSVAVQCFAQGGKDSRYILMHSCIHPALSRGLAHTGPQRDLWTEGISSVGVG